jgi:uncharacterized protein (TIGR02996 family)
MRTLDNWWARLVQNATNWDLRLVFADWLADQGLDELEAGQRWQAQHHKAPAFLMKYQHPWSWFNMSVMRGYSNELPGELFETVYPLGIPYRSNPRVIDFDSLAEAEVALAVALRALAKA